MPTREEFVSLISRNAVARDWFDSRDLKYVPSLAVLRNRVIPDRQDFNFLVRDQGPSGRCVGHALANLVDLQRRHQAHGTEATALARHDLVSADMLFYLAAFHDEYPELNAATLETQLRARGTPRDRIRSLRSAIKAFYHHGVCLDIPPGASPSDPARCWPSAHWGLGPVASQWMPTVDQAKAAREIGLGAYFRLDPVLNHYHAALIDTGAILVSAMAHEGWRLPFAPDTTEIGAYKHEDLGAHAFVIVGYTRDGFLVLNSWGPDWGGHEGLPGIALWRYGDWAETVMDGWVLRLGVSAPEAFDIALGPQGLSRSMGMIQTGSARCHLLLGHYLHLDDGFHVDIGSYPSEEKTWRTTRDYLGKILCDSTEADGPRRRRGVLLWIPGSLEGINPAVSAAIARKSEIAALDLYPYNIFWCNQFVEKSLEVLTTVFDSCYKQVKTLGPQLDALIEMQLRGIGRAFWRDIEQAARRAVHGTKDLPEEDLDDLDAPANPGPLVEVLRDLLKLTAAEGIELHIVTEGAGVLVLHEMLRYLDKHDSAALDDLHRRITTLSLIHPAIGLPRARKWVVPLVEKMNKIQIVGVETPVPPPLRTAAEDDAAPAMPPPRARIYLPSPALEDRLCFGVYSGSLLQLVSRSFEDRFLEGAPPEATPADAAAPQPDDNPQTRNRTHPSHPPRPFLGMTTGRERIDRDVAEFGDFARIAFSELRELDSRSLATGRVPYSDLQSDPLVSKEIFRTISRLRGGAAPPRDPVKPARAIQKG
ncbi:C1 family peptidase [Pararhodobacter sp. SW119]|uniref:C1 family peptidase n=1 Tax=Pararhodobacter sp. SW119 TaxID=2780075 RepID=UPI001ADF997B|nr:C1 family peptidase [Pararhodobacter sp. SW119]